MRVIETLGSWFDERLKVREVLRETAEHPVPRETASWFYVFGSAALTVFVLQVATGILLALTYVPSAGEAWNSLQILNHTVPLGWFIRALHGWGSNFMLAIVLIHMMQVFLFGAYKFPRELTWIIGVFLLLVTLGMAFTGQVLRFDQDAYWGLGIGASIASRVPVVGPALVNLLLGGPIIAAATLSRFFALHVFRDTGSADRICRPTPAPGPETGNQRMAHARTHRSKSHLCARISGADAQAWHGVCALCDLERCVFLRLHSACDRSLRYLFRALRSRRPAGSHDYSDGAASRFLFPVDLRSALLLAPRSETPILLIGPVIAIAGAIGASICGR